MQAEQAKSTLAKPVIHEQEAVRRRSRAALPVGSRLNSAGACQWHPKTKSQSERYEPGVTASMNALTRKVTGSGRSAIVMVKTSS